MSDDLNGALEDLTKAEAEIARLTARAERAELVAVERRDELIRVRDELDAANGALRALGSQLADATRRAEQAERERDTANRQLGLHAKTIADQGREIARLRAALAEERERCAKIAENMTGRVRGPITQEVAQAIRRADEQRAGREGGSDAAIS